MNIYHHLNELPSVPRGIMTIGTFDGFHRGHRSIIDRLIEDKEKNGGETFVLSFSNHPFEVLNPLKAPKRLGSREYKIGFLKARGIENLVLIPFTREFAETSHTEFFKGLRGIFQRLKLILGHDFRFGKENLGGLDYLGEMVDGVTFDLDVVSPVAYSGYQVSSSLIRNLIQEGHIEKANALLQREYFMTGACIQGDQVGRTIDYPTVNMVNQEQVYPKNGVYKTVLEIDEKFYSSMTFIGNKSLGDNNNQVIETHIFDFNESLYGETVHVHFQKRLRDQMKFNSLDELKGQLNKDKSTAQSLKLKSDLSPSFN